MEQLFLLFDTIRPLSPGIKNYIRSILVKKVIKKKEIILRKGEIAKYIYFIEKGVVRSFRYIRGKERTSWIMKEGDLFVSVSSFFSQKPASENIEAWKIVFFIVFLMSSWNGLIMNSRNLITMGGSSFSTITS